MDDAATKAKRPAIARIGMDEDKKLEKAAASPDRAERANDRLPPVRRDAIGVEHASDVLREDAGLGSATPASIVAQDREDDAAEQADHKG